MKWRLLSYDPLTGMKTYHAYDSMAKKNHIRHEYDVGNVLDTNQIELNASRSDWKGDWHKVAEVPLGVIHQWANEEGLDFYNRDHWPAIRKKLNSNEFRKFRTKGGNI